MSRVEQYLKRICKEAHERHPYGERLFQLYDIPHTHGMDIRSQYEKHNADGKFFLVQWMLCTKDGRRGREIIRVPAKYVFSYMTFTSKRKRDAAYLILEDMGLAFNNFGRNNGELY